MNWNDVKHEIAVERVTAEQWRTGGTRFADGVDAPGWYWRFKHDTHPDTWWFGPHGSADAAWLDCQESRWWIFSSDAPRRN